MKKSVRNKFAAYPAHIRPRMERLRALIYEVAAASAGVGNITETLKWGEPAYLTEQTGSGTTIRIDWKPRNPGQIGLYVSCNTTLIESFRSRFGDELTYEGNRAILLRADTPLPETPLKVCIQAALRYHLDK